MFKTIIATLLLTTTSFAAQSTYTPIVKADIINDLKEEQSNIHGFVKIDQDYMSGLQLSTFATYQYSENFGFAINALMAENYVYQTKDVVANSYYGEVDAGLFFNYKSLTLTPMVGIGFDLAAKKPLTLSAPQLDIIVATDKWYFESWNYIIVYSTFEKNLGSDYIHTRNWILYKPNNLFSFGPQAEYTYGIQHKHTIYGLPIGGHIEGTYNGNSLGMFLGYDVSPATNDSGKVAGRITLNHSF
jgi:hypothetical protein